MVRTRSAAAKDAHRTLSYKDQVAVVWFLIDSITHLFLEGSYFYFAWHGGATNFDGLFAWIWKEYSQADKRWEISDPNVMSIEGLTVFVVGPLCLLALYSILERKPYRHFVQACVCVAELYGCVMTFVPEWLVGSPNLVTDTWKHKWFYLAFMNGVWVVIPAILLWESGVRIIEACDKAKTEHVEGGIANVWHTLCVVTLVVYSVTLPAVVLLG